MKLFFLLASIFISGCTYIQPIKRITGPLQIEADPIAVRDIKLEINNIITPSFHHDMNLRNLTDMPLLKDVLSSALEKRGMKVTDNSSNVLTLELNRFYVRGGPGWITCKVEIFITARALIDGISVPPKQFDKSKRVYFCAFSRNDEKFDDTIRGMLSETISDIIQDFNAKNSIRKMK